VPKYAKDESRKGLQERKENKAGLTPKEAKKLGIFSGVARANQIINNKFLEEDDLKAIARFYIRFRGCKSPKCETAIKLWGGRKFGKFLKGVYYG
jgi:hypothetical protein